MKKNIIIAMTFIAIFLLVDNEAHSQYNPKHDNCVTKTPNNSNVYMKCWGVEVLPAADIASINQYYSSQYPNAILLNDASSIYNCHSYAWWWTSSANHAWMNNPNDDHYWNDGSYVLTNWNNGTHISYKSDNHSGRLIPGYPGWVYSKWGSAPAMIHWWTDLPYNDNVVKKYKLN